MKSAVFFPLLAVAILAPNFASAFVRVRYPGPPMNTYGFSESQAKVAYRQLNTDINDATRDTMTELGRAKPNLRPLAYNIWHGLGFANVANNNRGYGLYNYGKSARTTGNDIKLLASTLITMVHKWEQLEAAYAEKQAALRNPAPVVPVVPTIPGFTRVYTPAIRPTAPINIHLSELKCNQKYRFYRDECIRRYGTTIGCDAFENFMAQFNIIDDSFVETSTEVDLSSDVYLSPDAEPMPVLITELPIVPAPSRQVPVDISNIVTPSADVASPTSVIVKAPKSVNSSGQTPIDMNTIVSSTANLTVSETSKAHNSSGLVPVIVNTIVAPVAPANPTISDAPKASNSSAPVTPDNTVAPSTNLTVSETIKALHSSTPASTPAPITVDPIVTSKVSANPIVPETPANSSGPIAVIIDDINKEVLANSTVSETKNALNATNDAVTLVEPTASIDPRSSAYEQTTDSTIVSLSEVPETSNSTQSETVTIAAELAETSGNLTTLASPIPDGVYESNDRPGQPKTDLQIATDAPIAPAA